jgi:hypothetical protein
LLGLFHGAKILRPLADDAAGVIEVARWGVLPRPASGYENQKHESPKTSAHLPHSFLCLCLLLTQPIASVPIRKLPKRGVPITFARAALIARLTGRKSGVRELDPAPDVVVLAWKRLLVPAA